MDDHHDLIVVGSGPAGVTLLAHRLAPTRKRILVLERGDDLPRETGNWNSNVVFVQGCDQSAKSHPDQIRAEALPAWLEGMPDMPFEMMAHHSIGFRLSSEDLPRPQNRIRIDREQRVVLEVAPNNLEAHERLRAELKSLLENE